MQIQEYTISYVVHHTIVCIYDCINYIRIASTFAHTAKLVDKYSELSDVLQYSVMQR